MRDARGIGLWAAIGLLALSAGDALAVDYRVRSRTVGDAYQLVTSGGELLNRRRLHQYLGFGAYDLLGGGERALSVSALFRFDADFGVTDEELEEVAGLGREELSVQYMFIDGRALDGALSVRVGRQLFADGLGLLMLDGASLRVAAPWPVALDLLVGREVDESGVVSSFERDGRRLFEGEARARAPAWVLGASLALAGLEEVRARLSYRRSIAEGRTVEDKIGGDAFFRIWGELSVDSQASWDLFNGRFERVQARARWRISDAWEVEGEYLRLTPSFDAESIFNIFTTSPLNDGSLRVRLRPSAGERVQLGGMLRFFGNEGDADASARDEVEGAVRAWGAMAGYSRRFGREGRLRADFNWEQGYGGDRILADLGATWALVPGEWEIDGRLTGVWFADTLEPERDALSVGYQLGGRYLVEDKAALSVMAEQNFNRLQRQSFRLLFVADLDLWL